jgi:hypothetical protein
MPATTEVVYTQAQTEAMMDDTVRNPVRTDKRGEVNITLVFDGVSINPALIFDAIKTLGTAQTDKIPQGGNYSFIIS